jgi:hypothetical protein
MLLAILSIANVLFFAINDGHLLNYSSLEFPNGGTM